MKEGGPRPGPCSAAAGAVARGRDCRRRPLLAGAARSAPRGGGAHLARARHALRARQPRLSLAVRRAGAARRRPRPGAPHLRPSPAGRRGRRHLLGDRLYPLLPPPRRAQPRPDGDRGQPVAALPPAHHLARHHAGARPAGRRGDGGRAARLRAVLRPRRGGMAAGAGEDGARHAADARLRARRRAAAGGGQRLHGGVRPGDAPLHLPVAARHRRLLHGVLAADGVAARGALGADGARLRAGAGWAVRHPGTDALRPVLPVRLDRRAQPPRHGCAAAGPPRPRAPGRAGSERR